MAFVEKTTFFPLQSIKVNFVVYRKKSNHYKFGVKMQYVHETYEYILQLYGLFIYLKSFKSSLDDKLNPYIILFFI